MRPVRLIAAVLFAGAAAACVTNVLQHRRQDERARALDEQLKQFTARFHARRFERPVLRGTAAEGNAADAERALLEPLDKLDPKTFDPLTKLFRDGGPMPPAIVALVEQHRAALEALRAASQRTHAWTQVPFEQGASAQIPPFVSRLRTNKLLLAMATRADPADCMRIAADAIRIGQDGGAGVGLIGSAIAAAQTELAIPVLLRCAARADTAARRDAAREVAVLAAHPLPLGDAFEAEGLMAGGSFRGLALDVPAFPTSSAALESWSGRGIALDAWQHVAAEAEKLRGLDVRRVPEGLALLEQLEQAATRSPNPLVAMITPTRASLVIREATAQTHLRATVVLLEALADPAADPAGLVRKPELADPFSGRPLAFRREPAGLVLCSVGPDGKSDDGKGDDVVTTLPKP